jgi:hypothetical protein
MVRRKTHQEYATCFIPSSPTFDDNSKSSAQPIKFFAQAERSTHNPRNTQTRPSPKQRVRKALQRLLTHDTNTLSAQNKD